MKKIASSCLAAIAILFVLVLTSCDYRTPAPIQQTPTETTLIQKGFSPGDWVNALVSFERAVTKPRRDCNGRRLPQDKIVGYEKVTEVQCVQILGNCCECPPSNGGHGIGNPPVPAPSIVNNYPEPLSWLDHRSMWELFLLFVFFPWLLLLLSLLLFRRFWNSAPAPVAPPSTPPAPPAAGITPIPSINDFRLILGDMLGKAATFSYSNNGANISMTTELDPNAKPVAKSKAEKATTEKPSVEQPKQ